VGVTARLSSALVALVLLAACGGADAPAQDPAPGAAARITYVALGDSAGFGIGALPGDGGYPPRLARRLREAGRTVELVNLSVPGATARELARVQLPGLAARAATLLTVCVGANDAGDRAPADFGADIEAILAEVTKLGAPVVLCNVPDVSLTPKYGGDARVAAEVVAMNAELARVAARYQVPVADVYRASREQLYGNPELISIDGFHPSPAGYEVWAEAMFPAVKAALGIP
jgi:lysophospholipase L1-like esterase